MPECLFCSIIAGDLPAEFVLRTEQFVAFRDIHPQAPIHLLVVPTTHAANLQELTAQAPDLTVGLVRAAAQVAADAGIGKAYRLMFNTGADAGQSVFHVHAHVLGGGLLT